MNRNVAAAAVPHHSRLVTLFAVVSLVALALGLSLAPREASASGLSGAGVLPSPGALADGLAEAPALHPPTLLTRDALAFSSERPVRRRRPRGHGSEYRSRQFLSLGVGSFDPSDQPGSGFYFNGAIGTEISPPLDLGLQLSWYHRSRDGDRIISERTDPAGNTVRQVIETESVDTDLVPLMAILRVRFPVSPEVQPYVGAGIGWEWLLVEGVDDQGFAFSDDYDGFGTQLFGGVNLRLGPRTALYGEAVLNNSTVSAEFFDGFFGGTVREEIDVDGTGFHAGLRFRF